jgi:hypothetical protein
MMLRVRAVRSGFELPQWGNLRRRTPFSPMFGADRGLPVDRLYLHRFLERQQSAIQGDVLEIQLTSYTQRYGIDVHSMKSIDIDAKYEPTFVCDLAEADRVIPPESCFLLRLPQNLHPILRLVEYHRKAFRFVRPGGAILASSAGLLPLIPDAPELDFWRFSASGWRSLLSRVWPDADLLVESHGNCLTATAAMLGLASEDLSPADFDEDDTRYPVVVTVFARKPK